MRPTTAIPFESGLDRGVPWGRDLITFMTSAAGYMMRTLQKPRKNKPSKRQVNHRRFLHNMIQRKFTEIEAANHQLASVLFSVDTEPQRQSEVKSTDKDESEKKLKKATAVFSEDEPKPLDDDNDTQTLDSLVTNPNKNSLTSKSLNNLNNGKVNQIREDREEVERSGGNPPEEITDFNSEREQFQWGSAELSDLTPITNIVVEDSVFTSHESIERITDFSHVQIPNSPDGEQQHLGLTLFDLSPTSPVSPLSLNSCDFEVQIQSDNDHTFQIQQIAESLQMDLMENLELLDSEEYLQNIDQMDMAGVWDIHNEEDLSCFQDSLPFLNTSHTDFAMDKQASCGDGDICGGLHQNTTLLENSIKDSNVDDDLRSNVSYRLGHYGSSGHHNQARQTKPTVNCYVNQTKISTSVNKEGQNSNRGTWTICEQGNISRELKHDPPDQPHPKNWDLNYNNHSPSKVKCLYYMLTDEEKKIIESGPTLNPHLDLSSPVNMLSSSTAHCYSFAIPPQANSNCLGDLCSFSNHGGNQSIPSFDGVAQSFPAPYQNPHPHPVSTPPLNDDWLFSNIATEVDFNSMVRSHGHTYC
ncbi:hypothetical protein KOW79_000711 [Hemibagrus wyckioides]|uniref:Uncharacterized protein n=2 Tax=Hemibagrus wyckioides TaxID=337641 RepID=A0A9D3SYV7_9TELE|nr:hypothetical protein KOW79_000711 [Hemibagrus wyckioides]